LFKLRLLTTLDISNNNISGTLSDSLYDLQYLKTAYFSNNSITGTLPQAMFLLRQLAHLDLSLNMLEGTIPDSIGWVAGMGLSGAGCIAARSWTWSTGNAGDSSDGVEALQLTRMCLAAVVQECNWPNRVQRSKQPHQRRNPRRRALPAVPAALQCPEHQDVLLQQQQPDLHEQARRSVPATVPPF
jgi:Leucine-rich repeat (LRR) protein